MDIVLVRTNAKYSRASKRRQKRMLSKMKQTVFKDAWPTNIGEMQTAGSDVITVDVTFKYSIE